MSGPETAEGWVLQLGRTMKELSASEMHVLLTLAARHNRDYRGAWPKLDRLHDETHLSERQIVRVLNSLEDKRILGVEYGPLPTKARDGRVIHGNTYRFIGFDVPTEWDGGHRRRLGGHPPSSVDTMSTRPTDTMSTRQLPSTDGSVDAGDDAQLTSPNSPLRTRVVNPASAEGSNPILAPKGAPPAVNGTVQTSHKPPGNARVAEVIDAFRERLADSSVREPVFTGRDYAAIKMSTAPPELIVEVYEAVAVCEYGDQFMRKRLSVHEAIEWINGYVEWKAEQAWRNNNGSA